MAKNKKNRQDPSAQKNGRKKHVVKPLNNPQLKIGVAALVLAKHSQLMATLRAKAIAEGDRLAKLDVERLVDAAQAIRTQAIG